MKTAALLLATAAAVSASNLSEDQNQFLFSRYVEKFNKSYEAREFFQKFNVFKTNLANILEHNKNANGGHTLGINEFTDMTEAEFNKQMNLQLQLDSTMRKFTNVGADKCKNASLEGSVDWSALVNNPMKNQGRCGSCWAFSVVGALEYRNAIHQKKTDNIDRFSEQQLVDCDTADSGCNGGLMRPAYNYIKKNGICRESEYKYEGYDGTCRASQCLPYSFDNWEITNTGVDEFDLIETLKSGPTTIAINASACAFQMYRSGIISCPNPGGLNHAVVAVGYGVENGVTYIKVRNSWGTSWGEQGYFRMKYCDNSLGVKDSIAGGYDVYPKF